jgi:hypothetical protein
MLSQVGGFWRYYDLKNTNDIMYDIKYDIILGIMKSLSCGILPYLS